MNALAGLGLSGAYNRDSAAGQMLTAAQTSYAPALTSTPPPGTPGTMVPPRQAPPPPPPPDVPAETEGETATSKTKIAVIAGGLILLAVVAYFLAK